MRSAADPIRTLVACAAAVLVIAAAGAVPATASAATSARVCVSRLAILTSPDGFTVGYLFRGDRVRVVRRTANHRWARILSTDDRRGWVRARSVCR
jgi:hypothetical protein